MGRLFNRLISRPRRHFRTLPADFPIARYHKPIHICVGCLLYMAIFGTLFASALHNLTGEPDLVSNIIFSTALSAPFLLCGGTHIFYETRRCYELHFQTPDRTWPASVSLVVSNSVDMFILGWYMHDVCTMGLGVIRPPYIFWVLGMIVCCAIWWTIIYGDYVVAVSWLEEGRRRGRTGARG